VTLVIDCHGHYTVLPKGHDQWREAQIAAFKAGSGVPAYPVISDDEIRETLEANQLRLIRERGADMTIFSPRASAMAPHVGDQSVAVPWARACNDLIGRVVDLYPMTFAGVCMLPQSPEADMMSSVAELRRCVEELDFVGCNLNPDPGGGHFRHPPLTDPFWFPIYETMVELDVPAMIHVSGSCNPAIHGTGGYYIAADTIAFMQLIEGDLFARFPRLRFIIPHGGGAVPYHWGRYRGLADMLNKPDLSSHVMNNVYFDTCVYHQPGINLLAEVIDCKNILFGSEMVGAVRGIDPQTGHYFDDTKRYVDALPISEGERHAVFEGNARRVYPRVDARLRQNGL
jgi:4-oxalmesaconate hydratase